MSGLLVTQITVSVGRTVSTGNFEGVRVGAESVITLEEPVEVGSSEYKAAYKQAFSCLRAQVEIEVAKLGG